LRRHTSTASTATNMPQPLPPTIPESLNTSPHILLAYSRILQLEIANHEVHEKKLVNTRILGYLIREGPSTKAKERVAQEVNSCQNDDDMDELGRMYYDHFIRVCESPSTAVTALFLMVS
jgi:hypothetical protein